MKPSSKVKNIFIAISFLFLIFGTANCNLPGIAQPDPTQPETANPSSQGAAQEAFVTFTVEVPPDTPEGDSIILSILDEVTGLALNPQNHALNAIDETHHYISLSFPVGTTIKYRYARQGENRAEEHTSDDRAVRYRMYQVEQPGETRDVVSRWSDTSFSGSTGRITGIVFDAERQSPVPGILVAAGGAQALTSGDGSFLIEGMPPGVHNMVVYAPDGAYKTFQQGATVAAESNTPAEIYLLRTPTVDITFIVDTPEDTPPTVPIRLAGNLHQLGNTFADLSGGINTLATRMPELLYLPDGRYGIILALPVGADIRYKYTFGDGFWNAERTQNGDLVVRQLIVPDTPTMIEESVETWHSGDAAPITFDVTAPENTPIGEDIFIQFNPYGWTEPLPMWHLGEKRWAYILYSPLDLIDTVGYRFCRAGQCGFADDSRTPGIFTEGQVVKTSDDPQIISDQIPAWMWLEGEVSHPIDLSTIVGENRGQEFIAGVEIQKSYHPSWKFLYPSIFKNISSLNANWTVLIPSWTFTRNDPPVLEPYPGRDADWMDTVSQIRQARSNELQIALRPVANFPADIEDWWQTSPRDFSWWVSWFDRYRTFAIHHAELAEKYELPLLILGGDWMAPALPGSRFSDESPTGVPPDAGDRYRALISEIRQHYSGSIGWAVTYPNEILDLPDFLTEVDLLYVQWSAPLSEETDASLTEMQSAAKQALTEVYAAWLEWELAANGKKIIFSLEYPSASGATTGCLPDPIQGCIQPSELNYPAPDYPLINLDLDVQARAYHTMLSAINENSWISGVVSQGYYPPAVLHDLSTSIHGKPAVEILRTWFAQFVITE